MRALEVAEKLFVRNLQLPKQAADRDTAYRVMESEGESVAHAGLHQFPMTPSLRDDLPTKARQGAKRSFAVEFPR